MDHCSSGVDPVPNDAAMKFFDKQEENSDYLPSRNPTNVNSSVRSSVRSSFNSSLFMPKSKIRTKDEKRSS